MERHVSNLFTLVNVFPSGTRDFLFLRRAEDLAWEAINPLDLLKLDYTAKQLGNVGRADEPLALVLALCRLLVPCLHYRGSGRHLVVEAWSQEDLRGESIAVDVRTEFAKTLSADQAESYRAVSDGSLPPPETLAELFWETQTDLPALPEVFDDPDLGKLCKALYLHLVPDGQGAIEVDTAVTTRQVESLRAQGFVPLGTGIASRKLQPLFRKLLAVTVRYASQITGSVAEEIIAQRLLKTSQPALTAAEKEMLALRYGACRALNDVNVGFLFGCGILLAELINDYFLALTRVKAPKQREQAQKQLRDVVYLLRGYQQHRKQARAQERRDDRQHRADPMPQGWRKEPERQADASLPPPDKLAITHEEMACLEAMLPKLKGRDAERLRVFIQCGGDRKAAAAQLGLDHKSFSRQMRQTILPAIRKLASEQGFHPLN